MTGKPAGDLGSRQGDGQVDGGAGGLLPQGRQGLVDLGFGLPQLALAAKGLAALAAMTTTRLAKPKQTLCKIESSDMICFIIVPLTVQKSLAWVPRPFDTLHAQYVRGTKDVSLTIGLFHPD